MSRGRIESSPDGDGTSLPATYQKLGDKIWPFPQLQLWMSFPTELEIESSPANQLIRIATQPSLATGLRRWLFAGLGLLFVGIAILGAILPVLPTTPWVLLAGYCFARSSPRLHRWLRNSPYFGHLLRDWETHRGIRWRVKLFAVGMVITVIGLTVIFGRAPDWAKWSAVGLGSVGICVILFVVPTVWDGKKV